MTYSLITVQYRYSAVAAASIFKQLRSGRKYENTVHEESRVDKRQNQNNGETDFRRDYPKKLQLLSSYFFPSLSLIDASIPIIGFTAQSKKENENEFVIPYVALLL